MPGKIYFGLISTKGFPDIVTIPRKIQNYSPPAKRLKCVNSCVCAKFLTIKNSLQISIKKKYIRGTGHRHRQFSGAIKY